MKQIILEIKEIFHMLPHNIQMMLIIILFLLFIALINWIYNKFL